jgi:hypothetical protein
MGKKITVTALAVLAFGFASAPRSSAGGSDVVEPYRAPAPRYNYAPPPRPVVYVPPVRFGFFIGPGYGFYGPRFGFFHGHRFHGRHAHWRGHHRHWR